MQYYVMSDARTVVTDLILEIFRLNGELLAAGDKLVAELGLTSARWQVLGAIALSPVPLPVAHIARNMGLSRQAVQRLVNEIYAQGLVGLETNPHHQRAKLVVLTAQGKAVYAAAMERQLPWAGRLAAGLSSQDLAAAVGVLRRLRGKLQSDGDGQSKRNSHVEKHS